MIRRLICVAVFAASPFVRADEQVRSVQEELRRRNIYFGDVDGRKTGELDEAVKRYQKRKGFASNGETDRDTLRSLGLAARTADEAPPKELAWPEEPVLKSDVRIDVPAAAQEISQDSGVIIPIALEPMKRQPASSSRRTRTAAAPAAPRGRAPTRLIAKSAANTKLTEEAIRKFVSEYLRALTRDDIEDELEFYADQVDYFANGLVDRRIVEHALRRYYQRWPDRKYSLGSLVNFRVDSSRGEIAVVFRVNFSLKNGRQRIKGATDNQFIINAATEDPRIVSVREHRVRT
jgi:peptidoglycan hydrolase-like protein with peptidoglycan-binding domain